MIYVRSRKYGYLFNNDFTVRDGPNLICDTSQFRIGERVKFMLEIDRDKFDSIDNMQKMGGLEAHRNGLHLDEYMVYIPFRIVDIEHTFGYRKGSREEYPHLRWAGDMIVLEAETGHWEDVYLWWVEGKRPTWAGEPEEQEVKQDEE